MMKKITILFVMVFITGIIYAGEVSVDYKGFKFSYSWSSDKSLADDSQIRQAVQQGFQEGVNDGIKDKNNSSTTHYGDSYSRYSYSNSYVQERYKDAYMEGYKKGAGKPPSVSDSIWW